MTSASSSGGRRLATFLRRAVGIMVWLGASAALPAVALGHPAEIVRAADLGAEAEAKILGGSAAQLLGLEGS